MRASGPDHHAVHSRSLGVDHFLFVLFVLLDLERFGNVGLPHGGLDLVQLCVDSSATGKDGDAFCLRPGGNDLIDYVVCKED